MRTLSKTDDHSGGMPACLYESWRQTLPSEVMALALGLPRHAGDPGAVSHRQICATCHTALCDLQELTIAAYAAAVEAAPTYPRIDLSFLRVDRLLLPNCPSSGSSAPRRMRAREDTEGDRPAVET